MVERLDVHSLSWLIPDDAVVDWRHKCLGPAQVGKSVREIAATGTRISALPTPLVTLDATAVEHNIAVMNSFLNENRILLSPHGKTTMSPQLWQRQLDAGAWAITVATPWQLRVAVHHGVKRIQHAGAVLDPTELRAVADMLSTDPGLEVYVWVDSVDSAEITAAGYPPECRPLNVLVERGGVGGRTGARTLAESIDTAEVVHKAANLNLAGVAAWEGSLQDAQGPSGRELVARFCDGVADTFRSLLGAGYLRAEKQPLITGGGSAFFDIVVERWAPLMDLGAMIVLRSGCYLTHDDGFYAHASPFECRTGSPLRAALNAWAQVVSRPESGLVILNAGRRDISFDQGFPIPQAVRGTGARQSDADLRAARISSVNDQHSYMTVADNSSLSLGDVVRLGISHPCTTFDKWTMVPIVDDATSADPMIIGAVRTYF